MSSAREGLGRRFKLAALVALCLGVLLSTAQGAQAQVPPMSVTKAASPTSLSQPGGAFTYSIVVTNTSGGPLTITGLTDNVYGNLTLVAGSSCNTAVGTVLAASPGPGNTYSCSFQGMFTGVAGDALTDVVTATAITGQAVQIGAADDATVTITAPAIAVDKTATPLTRPEPGGSFTFDVSVTNAGSQPVTITTLTDDVYGNIATQGTCTTAVGTVLQGAGVYTCSFTGSFNGNANASQTDTVTATAVDGLGDGAGAADQATVTLTDVAPTIDVVKTAEPSSLVEPGGTFTFGVTVVNTSAEAVTITTILDDVYGNLDGRGDCATGASVAPSGGTYTCFFDGDFTGNGGQSQTDTVTVTVVDDDGTNVSDSDTATVTLTDRPISVIIGDTTQTNTQTSTATQSIEQSQTGGGIVVFGGGQDAENSSDTSLGNAQSVGGDGSTDSIIMGNTTQTNTQDGPTDQHISQLTVYGSDPVIFGGSQSSENEQSTQHTNSQNVGGASAKATAKKKAKAKARATAKAKARAKARALAKARARSAARTRRR